MRITVADDGAGFDEALLASEHCRGHWGVQGMKERIERLGGRMVLRSRPLEGTAVVLFVPATVAYREVSLAGRIGTFLSWGTRSRRRHHD